MKEIQPPLFPVDEISCRRKGVGITVPIIKLTGTLTRISWVISIIELTGFQGN